MRRRLVSLIAFAAVALAVALVTATGSPFRSRAALLSDPAAAPGCTPARPHASGTSNETIMTVDGTRTYRLHVPPSYTGATAVPLVFNLHGATSNAASQEAYSAFSPKADAQNFIVVYPQGLTTSLITYTHWNAWQLGNGEPDDLGFMTSLLDTLESQLCIDADRVFSTGMSNGAIMSIRLACSLSSRIAAIGPVAGAYYPPDANNINPNETCPDTKAVPMIAFHGTADSTVPFNGGLGGVNGTTNFRLPLDNTTPAEDVLADWASHNTCGAGRQESQVSSEVRLVQYGSCSLGADVQLYAVDGGGHTWPGATDVPSLGYTTHQISATDLMWSFFVAHPMASAAPPVGGVATVPEPLGGRSGGGSAMPTVWALITLSAIGVAGWVLRKRRQARVRPGV